MDKNLNKTKNFFRCVGTVNELDLKREPCKVKLFTDGQETGETDGKRIRGRVSVKTASGVHIFDVYNQIRSDAQDEYDRLVDQGKKNDKSVQNLKRQIDYFHMFEEMMNWVPAMGDNAGDEPTLVNITGSVSINDYVNQNNGEVSSSLRWNVRSGNTRVSPDDPTGVTLNATLFIARIYPETKGDEETGRLVVEMYGANNKGACFPVKAFVEADMADDFVDCYETGMTVPFEIEAKSHHVGSKNGGKRKFGHAADVAVNDGFDVSELTISGGGNEIEEPDEMTTEDEDGNEVEVKTEWIDPELMKIAVVERSKMLEELKKNPPERKSSKSNETDLHKAKKASTKNGAKFGVKSNTAAEPDDFFADMPF